MENSVIGLAAHQLNWEHRRRWSGETELRVLWSEDVREAKS